MSLYNLVRVHTSTTGTGTVTIGAAVLGYLDFTNVTDGAVVSYGLHEGNQSEVGRGTYNATAGTLARTTILASTNSGSAITLDGKAELFITALAEDITNAPISTTGSTKVWSATAISSDAQTIIADGTGDVTEAITVQYSGAEITGAFVGGGVVVLEPGDSMAVVSDATSILTLTCAANGSVTIARSAGTDTFKFIAWMVWI